MNQQVISYHQVELHQVDFSTPAISPNGTPPASPPLPPQSWGFNLTGGKIQPLIQGAVYSGLFSNPDDGFSSYSSSESSSGQTYQSLAVCDSCYPTTRNLTNEDCAPNQWMENADFALKTQELGSVGIVNASFIINDPDNHESRAGECLLYWCLRTYNNPNSQVEQSTSWNKSVSISNLSDSRNFYYMIPNDTRQNPFLVNVHSSCQISKWMSNLLTGSGQYQNSDPCPKSQKRSIHSSPEQCDNLFTGSALKWKPIIAHSFGNFSSVPIEKKFGFIANKFGFIAKAMTDQIQSTLRSTEPTTSSSPAQAVTTSQTTIHQTTIKKDLIMNVQWAWLTLPIALLALAFIFQITTIVRTSRRKTALWKSSTLALFFHGRGVQEGVHSAGGVITDDIAGMEDEARRMKVRLENTGRCWRLTEERRRVV